LLAEVDGPLPNGNTNSPKDSDITQYQYDPRGAYLIQIIAPGNTTTQLSYDLEGARAETGGTGRVSQVENSNGAVTSTRYAITGKPIEIEQWYKDSTNQKTRYQYRYDALGKPVEYLINQRPQALNVYDNSGKLAYQASHSGLLTELNYSSQGDPLRVTSRYGQQAQILDIHNYRLNQVQNDVNDAERIHSLNQLDQHFSATSFKSVYDDFGREIYVAHPDYGTLTKRFNANNQLIGQINQQGEQQTIQYNLAGQRVAETITPIKGASSTTRWTYTYGKLTAIHHPLQQEKFNYGVQGRLASHTVYLTLQNGKTITHNTRYQYDEQGKVLGHSLADGSFLQYERNQQDQMVGITRHRSPSTWLGWSSQPIVNDLQRDITGLSHITYGNGVKGLWQRSEQGVLARIRYTLPQQANPSALIHQAFPNKLLEYLVSTAYAQTEDTGLPTEPDALFDQRLIYSEQGDVLLQQHAGLGIHKTQAYAYNLRHQLVAAQQSATAPQSKKNTSYAPQETVWRYVYDARGNRLLAQENVSVDEMHQTRRTDYHLTTHQAVVTEGHPQHNNMQFEWNVLGQLVSVQQHNAHIASYQYNAHGLRIAKHTQLNKTQSSQHTYYLYNLQRKRIAELNSDGHITRQYIWLGDQLVATLDAHQPQPPRAYASGFLAALQQTISILWQRLINQQDQLHYVHINHLHAPVAVTDTQARVVWQTDYAPYGGVIKTVTHSTIRRKKPAYQLALRYAGQWQDDETGLYYNDFRYYNPTTGRYITPDPLGKMAERFGSPNPYSYVNNNPLSYIDPWGLILFAFDGTGNTDEPNQLAALENGFSNVINFRELYNDGNARYISGVGTIDYSDINRPIDPKDYVPLIVKLLPFATTVEKDMAFNYSGRARIERMQEYFNEESDDYVDDQAMDVDIIGFSRGAAQARDFANQIMKSTKQDILGNYWYAYQDKDNKAQCQKVNFRFMGLWDTVLSTDAPLGSYNLHLPEAFQHVAHAIALNEHRGDTFRTLPGSTGAFPLESIVGVTIPANQTRIEKGFIGAHADIGGGFANNNQLAQVALTWMYEQARAAGVAMKSIQGNTIIANPVIHDKSDNQYARDMVAKPADSNEDRTVTYQDGSTVKQKDMTTAGMTWLDTQNFITYNPAGVGAREEQSNGTIKETYAEKPADASVGTVDMAAYLTWLKAHGYTLGDLQVQ
jgi:RHS repeat-associated protein